MQTVRELLCGIYRITSPVGKIYIGQSKNFEQRFYDYRTGKCPQQRKLFNSFYKYGFLNHIVEIIEICEVDELDCRERHWQDFYEVKHREKGLNCVLVSCGDKKEEKIKTYRKEKLSNNRKEKIFDERCGATPLGTVGRKATEFERFKLSIIKDKLTDLEKEELLLNFKEGDLIKRYNDREDLKNKLKKDKSRVHHLCKTVLDTQTGVFYDSLKELCSLYGFSYSTMKNRLQVKGNFVNNTQFIYA